MKKIVAVFLSLTIFISCAVPISALNIIIIGDTNADKIINATDALTTLQYAVGKYDFDSDFNIYRIDVNIDQNISTTDALLILQYSVGKINTFPRTYVKNEIAEEHTSFTMPTEKVNNYWLQWYTLGNNAEQLMRPNGTYPTWDWVEAEKRGINMLHVIFYPLDKDGNTIYNLPNTNDLASHCETMQYEIEKTHDAGIKVIAYSTDVQFKEEEAKKMGYTVEQLTAIKNKTPITDFAWDPTGTYIACINSPQWRDWCRANLKVIAEAGFDGVQYDYGPYAAQGGYCDCENCHKLWNEHCLEVYGVTKDYPCGELSILDETHLEFTRFLSQQLADFFIDTCSEAKKVNPDFDFIMNESVMSNMYADVCLSGAYDLVSSEYWGVEAGYESSLFMYSLTEALGFDSLHGIFNVNEQIDPMYRYKIAIAESYAVNGGISLGYGEEADAMLDFVAAHPELYQKTESRANTAVLFSSESALFSGSANDAAVSVGKALGAAGVTFDYIVLEKEGAIEKLDNYDVYVIPEFKYFDNTWEPYIQQIMQSNKEVIILGDTADVYIEDFSQDTQAKIKHLKSTNDLTSTLKESNVYDLLRCEKTISKEDGLEFTVRHLSWKYDFIHMIRLADYVDIEDKTASFIYKIPKGNEIEKVIAYCPYAENGQYEIPVDYTIKNGILKINTGSFDFYSVISIEYKD